MISKQKFINQSLELNLFFLRIMKEHSIFLEAAFAIKDIKLINQADALKNEFTRLLSHAIFLSQGILSSNILEADEIVTQYTMEAERATQSVTGIYIDTSLTSVESSMAADLNNRNVCMLAEYIYNLNNNSIAATSMIIQFKTKLKNDVLACRIFTTAYPLLIDHILREAILFRQSLIKLQNGIELDIKKDILDQEAFWNRIMSEHSFFIRGLLDPTEVDLFNTADNFGKEFEKLMKEASDANKSSLEMSGLTQRTLNETIKLKDFKVQGTEGLLACKIKSIIVPLLGDHVLREANRYIRLLKYFNHI